MFAYLMTWMQLKTDRRAVTAIEYALIASVTAVVVIAAFALIGPGLTTTFGKISTAL